jgi:hypothetical protein
MYMTRHSYVTLAIAMLVILATGCVVTPPALVPVAVAEAETLPIQATQEAEPASANDPTYPMKLEHLADVVVHVNSAIVGPSTWGMRVLSRVVDGSVKGSKLSGKWLPVGGDAFLIRADNCAELDVRGVMETDDGATIYTSFHGVGDFTAEQVEQLKAGQIPEGLRVFIAPRFETAHPDYQWLTRIQAVGLGSMESDGDLTKVTFSWYLLAADTDA